MSAEGGCSCGALRYRLTGPPLVVHACHCRDCQRLTGSAFGVNIWIEAESVALLSGKPARHAITAGSGKPHELFYCPDCATYVWSRYHASPAGTLFVHAGSLDDPGPYPPDVHIFTRSQLPWVRQDDGKPRYEEFYPLKEVWPAESVARLRAVMSGNR